jgi:hypothetical protein
VFWTPTITLGAPKYLDYVLVAWRDVQATVRRTGIAKLVLIAAFLLLQSPRGAVELTYSGLKVADSGPVLVLIPAVVSFLAFEFIALQAASKRYEKLRNALVAKLHPEIAAHGLIPALNPPTIALWGATPGKLEIVEDHAARRILDGLQVFIGLMVAFAGFLFLAYAYWRLFAVVRVSTLAVGASLFVSLVNVLRVGLVEVSEFRAATHSPDLSTG